MGPGGRGWPLMKVSSVKKASWGQSISGKAVGNSTGGMSGTGGRVIASRLVPLLALRAVPTNDVRGLREQAQQWPLVA